MLKSMGVVKIYHEKNGFTFNHTVSSSTCDDWARMDKKIWDWGKFNC